MISFWSRFREPGERDAYRRPVPLACNNVRQLPRSAMLVGKRNAPASIEIVAKQKDNWLLPCSIGCASSAVSTESGCAYFLIKNIPNYPQLLSQRSVCLTLVRSLKLPKHTSFPRPTRAEVRGNDVDVKQRPFPQREESAAPLTLKEVGPFRNVVWKTPVAKHQILKDEMVHRIRQRPYRVSPKQVASTKDGVNEVVGDYFSQRPKSPWALPVVSGKKKDGRLRSCTCHRKLNDVTKKDVHRCYASTTPSIGFTKHTLSRRWT